MVRGGRSEIKRRVQERRSTSDWRSRPARILRPGHVLGLGIYSTSIVCLRRHVREARSTHLEKSLSTVWVCTLGSSDSSCWWLSKVGRYPNTARYKKTYFTRPEMSMPKHRRHVTDQSLRTKTRRSTSTRRRADLPLIQGGPQMIHDANPLASLNLVCGRIESHQIQFSTSWASPSDRSVPSLPEALTP